MEYFDDILNVYAYLRSKSAKIAHKSVDMAKDLGELNASTNKMIDETDSMIAEMDEMLSEMRKYAEENGIDISDIDFNEEPPAKETAKPEFTPTELKIDLPPDFDYEKDFERLVREAHEAGFVNVHPEELLTAEEMKYAEEFSQRLDDEFAASVSLQNKDVAIVLIAAAIRVSVFFAVKALNAKRMQKMAAMGAEDVLTDAGKTLTNADGIVIDPMGNVQIDQLIDQAKEKGGKSFVKAGAAIVDKIVKNKATIQEEYTILNQCVPFDLEENNKLSKKDIVAYNKYIGWIVGIINILTDTVTTFKGKSYMVKRSCDEGEKPKVDSEISTLLGIVIPTMESFKTFSSYKSAVIAATVKEALALDMCKGDSQDVSVLVERAFEVESKTFGMSENAISFLNFVTDKVSLYIGGVGVNIIIDTIISAIHAVVYEENDGSLEAYAVRTSKIILYSEAMAATINSLPALITEDFTQVDFAGILTTLLALFQSTKFWIEAKTNFLVSSYKKELDRELDKVNKYFN